MQEDPPTRLATRRLVGRPIRADDFVRMRRLHEDPRVMATLSADGEPVAEDRTHAVLDRWLAQWDELGVGVWVFEDDGSFVGYAGVAPTDEAGRPGFELLYAVPSALWGRGYASEMAAAARDAALLRHGIPDLVAFSLPHNVPSRRVLERTGFREAGTLVHAGLEHLLYRLDGKPS